MKTKIVELILTQKVQGQGTVDDRTRIVTQLYTKEGLLVAEYDPCFPKSMIFLPEKTIV